ncbi:MAG: aldehyde dehydrogenase family protein [Actinomycetota bacterium]|nr:aldehyde dehydrogenase family protein [Actinomycetota bacterium]
MTDPITVPAGLLHIDGKWTPSVDGNEVPVVNPATGEQIGSLAAGTSADVDLAVAAARRQFDGGQWSTLSGLDRARLLWRLADLVEEHKEDLAKLEALDIGRPFFEPMHIELPSAVDTFRHFAGWADKVVGTTFNLADLMGRARTSYTIRQPIGVVGAITPWNAPTMIASWKLAPALAAGNTIVLKSAEDASLSTMLLVDLIDRAGFPPGVVNLVTGTGATAGDALVRHPGVDKISFTGSPEVGSQIASLAASSFKRVSLELGGKSPQIIRPDVDLDDVITTASIAIFANQGQTCAAGSRLLVHEHVFDEFVERLVAFAEGVKVGDPFAEDTQMGTLINASQLARVTGLVEQGRSSDASLLTGGSRIGDRGYFFEPTLFVASNENILAREEIFGPVGTIIRVSDDDEAIRVANDTSYGLSAVVWTKDNDAVNRYAKALNAGTVWVNAWGVPHPAMPWLGMKTSGIGEELGAAGLMAETVERSINVIG